MNRIKDFLTGNIYLILVYRLLLLYVAYSISRILFYFYNVSHFTHLEGHELFTILKAGLLFDTSAIVYTNMLYIVLFLLPFKFRHKKYYQGILMVLFFITNGIALIANFADIPYFEFVLQRTTMDFFDQFKNEENMGTLLLRFLWDYWYLTVLWIVIMSLMLYLYRKVKVGPPKIKSPVLYFISGIFMFGLGSILVIGGARGGFKQFAQPITMNNAWSYVKKPEDAAIVLNTPFTLMHTLEKRGFDRVNYFSSEKESDRVFSPVHRVMNYPERKENIVILIIESLNKEFVGSLNKDLEGGTYKGFTPFLDSIVGVSKVFSHSYANGRKSIDILPSLFCSLPRMGIPFVLMTPYYRNKLNSLPGLLKEKGYKSAFFHGAPDGSFGFQSFTHIIGVDDYYGMDEYNNIKDYDGYWGIWDEEFMQYFATTIDTFSAPFFASLFTVTSHHPFALPEKYKGRFTRGELPLERSIEYTDYSLRRFFEKASGMSWYSNTLFIITADHVSINQRPEFKNDIGYFSVPIIFYKPGSDMTGMDTITNAQQIDIMPTVLNYLGYNRDFIAFGKDLFNKGEKNYAFNYLNDTYRLFLNDKLLVFNGKEVNSYSKLYTPHSLMELGKDVDPVEQDSVQLFMKAFIQQYVNRMIDDRLSVKQPGLK
jgi:phosphoglycerol transferase MdoB-like AlkP superfamily enzyme